MTETYLLLHMSKEGTKANVPNVQQILRKEKDEQGHFVFVCQDDQGEIHRLSYSVVYYRHRDLFDSFERENAH